MVIEIAEDEGILFEERNVDMTELYIADEIFVSGTSAYIAPVIEVDGRKIDINTIGPITKKIRDRMQSIQAGKDTLSERYMTKII